MVTDIIELVGLCEEELTNREYDYLYHKKISSEWQKVILWMQKNSIFAFDETVGFSYADEHFGTHLMTEWLTQTQRRELRAVRMLTSYQILGDFEFRTPFVEYTFNGIVGNTDKKYLEHLKNVCHLAAKTLDNKRLYLYDFSYFMKMREMGFGDIDTSVLETFFIVKKYTLSSRHNCASCLKNFFNYAYDNGMSQKDASVYVLGDGYRKNCKLPTTYTETEIKSIIESVERSSSTGKRDYLILLLAAEYGWRAADIRTFEFDEIDWDKNVIRFRQHKTDNPVDYPLLASVGNAIIDYLKNGRPKSDAQEIILSANNETFGQPISSPTIHSIVSKYMKQAGIKSWKTKKHGPHSLRHSLATNMLKKNQSLPIISTVLGHQTTETTKIYLKVDTDKLSTCPLPTPKLLSPYYTSGGIK